ncbi:MAG: DUF294 nucleotidyltransferase-like domain-containing protein, partial [Acidobacteriota bacterium]|nr:DUF294 nucleotidyltransferase-like domain-containing protein [Acidobacteriota bacterium]
REGAKAHHITSVITEVTEKLLRQALSLIRANLEPAPVTYSLVLIGQAGRRELSLDRRLTLGVVLADKDRGASAEEVHRYFARTGTLLGQALTACGMVAPDPCIAPERICAPSQWIDHLDSWGEAPVASRPSPGILEMRAVSGDSNQVEELRRSLLSKVASDDRLLPNLSKLALASRPPLGFFRRLVVDTTGEHRNELDLYESGVRPFVDAIRVFACENGIQARQSRDRLVALRKHHSFGHAEEVENALEYLQTLRIDRQLACLAEQREVDGFLNPEELTRNERKTLKEAFQLATSLHEQLVRRYTQ